jgi:hypothetical protein
MFLQTMFEGTFFATNTMCYACGYKNLYLCIEEISPQLKWM